MLSLGPRTEATLGAEGFLTASHLLNSSNADEGAKLKKGERSAAKAEDILMCRLTSSMSCKQKWRGLCACKGRDTFVCPFHAFVRRLCARRDEMTCEHFADYSAHRLIPLRSKS